MKLPIFILLEEIYDTAIRRFHRVNISDIEHTSSDNNRTMIQFRSGN